MQQATPHTLQEALNTLNAHLIASAPRDNLTIVLARVPGAVEPYVTWTFIPETGALIWGHYFSNQTAASRDFNGRTGALADEHGPGASAAARAELDTYTGSDLKSTIREDGIIDVEENAANITTEDAEFDRAMRAEKIAEDARKAAAAAMTDEELEAEIVKYTQQAIDGKTQRERQIAIEQLKYILHPEDARRTEVEDRRAAAADPATEAGDAYLTEPRKPFSADAMLVTLDDALPFRSERHAAGLDYRAIRAANGERYRRDHGGRGY